MGFHWPITRHLKWSHHTGRLDLHLYVKACCPSAAGGLPAGTIVALLARRLIGSTPIWDLRAILRGISASGFRPSFHDGGLAPQYTLPSI